MIRTTKSGVLLALLSFWSVNALAQQAPGDYLHRPDPIQNPDSGEMEERIGCLRTETIPATLEDALKECQDHPEKFSSCPGKRGGTLMYKKGCKVKYRRNGKVKKIKDLVTSEKAKFDKKGNFRGKAKQPGTQPSGVAPVTTNTDNQNTASPSPVVPPVVQPMNSGNTPASPPPSPNVTQNAVNGPNGQAGACYVVTATATNGTVYKLKYAVKSAAAAKAQAVKDLQKNVPGAQMLSGEPKLTQEAAATCKGFTTEKGSKVAAGAAKGAMNTNADAERDRGAKLASVIISRHCSAQTSIKSFDLAFLEAWAKAAGSKATFSVGGKEYWTAGGRAKTGSDPSSSDQYRGCVTQSGTEVGRAVHKLFDAAGKAVEYEIDKAGRVIVKATGKVLDGAKFVGGTIVQGGKVIAAKTKDAFQAARGANASTECGRVQGTVRSLPDGTKACITPVKYSRSKCNDEDGPSFMGISAVGTQQCDIRKLDAKNYCVCRKQGLGSGSLSGWYFYSLLVD